MRRTNFTEEEVEFMNEYESNRNSPEFSQETMDENEEAWEHRKDEDFGIDEEDRDIGYGTAEWWNDLYTDSRGMCFSDADPGL